MPTVSIYVVVAGYGWVERIFLAAFGIAQDRVGAAKSTRTLFVYYIVHCQLMQGHQASKERVY